MSKGTSKSEYLQAIFSTQKCINLGDRTESETSLTERVNFGHSPFGGDSPILSSILGMPASNVTHDSTLE